MQNQNRFVSGMAAGVLLMVAASGMHWFIAPISHPNATVLQRNWVIGQIVIGAAGTAWLIIRDRSRKSAAPAL